jgi:hypothetical protein
MLDNELGIVSVPTLIVPTIDNCISELDHHEGHQAKYQDGEQIGFFITGELCSLEKREHRIHNKAETN